MRKLEVVVNANLEGVILGRIRSIDGKVIGDVPSIRLAGKEVSSLTKGDGLLLEANTILQKGNYIYAPDAKILDLHYSGKPFQLEDTENEPEDMTAF